MHQDKRGDWIVKSLGFNCVEWALLMTEEYQRAATNVRRSTPKQQKEEMRRMVLNIGKGLLLFTDAGFPGGIEKCRTGMVVTDENGSLVNFKRGEDEVVESPLEAELLAIYRGLRDMDIGGLQSLIIFSDCLEAVEAINGKEVIWNRGGYTLDSICEELSRFKEWKVCHICRELNEAAHLHATMDGSLTDSSDWVSNRVNSWIRELGS